MFMSTSSQNPLPTSTETLARRLQGVVVSGPTNKTTVVRVDRTVVHSKYQKRYTQSKRYKIHDEAQVCVLGTTVEFESCRPLSKEKRWRFVRKIETV